MMGDESQLSQALSRQALVKRFNVRISILEAEISNESEANTQLRMRLEIAERGLADAIRMGERAVETLWQKLHPHDPLGREWCPCAGCEIGKTWHERFGEEGE